MSLGICDYTGNWQATTGGGGLHHHIASHHGHVKSSEIIFLDSEQLD